MLIELTCNTEDEVLFANVARNASLRRDWVKSLPAHDGHAVIVGGGPSLEDYFPKLVSRARHGQTVFALNGAAGFLNARGVLPDYQVIMDARPENITLLSDACEYLLASQCDPGLVSAAKGPVRLWHPCIEGIDAHLPEHGDEYALIGGGTTVGLSAMCLAYTLGFRNMHLYGFDCSHREGLGHAYRQPMNLADPLAKVTVDGQTFTASLTMAGQAERFPIVCDNLIALGCAITVESDGLIKAVMAQTQKAPEPITEAEKYARIWEHDAYRQVAPGEGCAETFVAHCKPGRTSRVIDFGCGTGRGAKRVRELTGAVMMLVDLADNCRDVDCDLPFLRRDLSKPMDGLKGDLGYCTDVMEHIPTEDVPAVIGNIMACVPECFFKIAMFHDNMGALIGHPLHLSVYPVEWWREQFAPYAIAYEASDEGAALPYCTFHIKRKQQA
jgi:hypothetical protein